MDLVSPISQALSLYVQTHFKYDPFLENKAECTINADESKQAFGDISTNVAMVLAQHTKRNPREIASSIASGFTHGLIERVEIAGPGFLNFFLTQQAFHECATDLFTRKRDFFKETSTDKQHSVSIEFVSANPTGPLHFGHGRGGIIGDVLAKCMTFVGYNVTKEFYINDAGSQITKLGASLKARCQQACGLDVEIPVDGYAGEYLLELARSCISEYGDAVCGQENSFFEQYAKEHLLEQIKKTLALYGITFDVWFSERELHVDGSIDSTLTLLAAHGYLYEKDGAMWFHSTAFGDDKDRVMKKGSGELTYVAADAAYLRNKAERGFDTCIIILGYDHHGYVQRLQGLRQAMGLQASLDAILYQLVKIKSNGEQVRMSKRAGNIVSLEQVIEEVGTDVARFFYLNRKADAQLEFDLDLACTKTEENPVYYVQYAYVRMNSIFTKAALDDRFACLKEEDISCLTSADDKLILKKIVVLKTLLLQITHNYQTHLLAYYVVELAQAFHRYYGKHRIVDMTDVSVSRGRLLLVSLVKESMGLCMQLMGIQLPEKM